MAGLDPAISSAVAASHGTRHNSPMKHGGWVYIVTNRRDGVLYVGVTSDLPRRIWEHREGMVEGFTRRYHLTKLVWAKHHGHIVSAIQREKNIKHWSRAWKIKLIETVNPAWEDLYGDLSSLS